MTRTCQWIKGRPRPDDKNKCGKACKDGSSYCDNHHSVVFVHAKDKRAALGPGTIRNAERSLA